VIAGTNHRKGNYHVEQEKAEVTESGIEKFKNIQ
jgi:hypothetical protein